MTTTMALLARHRTRRVVDGVAVVAGGAILLAFGLCLLGRGTAHALDLAFLVAMGATAAAILIRAVLVGAERPAWLALGLGVLAFGCGDLYAEIAFRDATPPFPSLADALYLAYYPLSYVGLMLLVRGRMSGLRPSLWLDGLLGALGVAALGAALVFGPIARTAEGNAVAVGVTLAYPLADLVLGGVVIAVFALSGWRPGATWGSLGAGLAFNAVADTLYLYLIATGQYGDGSPVDWLWPAGMLLVAYAAWLPGRDGAVGGLGDWRLVAMPASFALVGLGLLVFGYYAQRLNGLAAALAVATLLAAFARAGWTVRENLRMLASSQRDAATDALTGLANRRRIMEDLDAAIASADLGRPRLLALFDLDGFKGYNDTFGHPAGDALLTRLSHRLRDAVRSHGTAYRLGGDEFCVLLAVPGDVAARVLDAAAAALEESGEGFSVSTSVGSVELPAEATSAPAAMRLADERLYRDKADGQRAWVGGQTQAVLSSVLTERRGLLAVHAHGVADLARAVGRRLGLGSEALDELVRAAALHDVGKLALPDAVLQKAGPLDEQEKALIREHSRIGERVLSAAPALVPVARLVRASHERYDGTGYPDGLAGVEIPLGARIIAVCDAYDAMTSERPYRPARSVDLALAELRQGAGGQFDPDVVDAFLAVRAWEREPALAGPRGRGGGPPRAAWTPSSPCGPGSASRRSRSRTGMITPRGASRPPRPRRSAR